MKRIRHAFLFSVTLLLCLTVGCVGRRQALTTAQQVRDVSNLALLQMREAKAALTNETHALRVTRQAYQDAYVALANARADAAKQNMQAATDRHVAALYRAQAEALSKLDTMAAEVYAGFQQNLAGEINRLDDEEAKLKTAVTKADETAAGNPNRDSHAEAQKARIAYLGLAGVNREIELVARKEFLTALQEEQKRVAAELRLVTADWVSHMDATQRVHTSRLPIVTNTPPDIGDDPPDMSKLVDQWIRYVVAVTNATGGLEHYIRANSFGTGSFLETFAKSFSRGLIRGIVPAMSGKGVTFAEAGAAGKDLWNSYQTDLQSDLREAEAMGKGVLKDTTKDALELVKTKGKDIIANHVLKKKS